jgi:hypothetical protein
VAGSFGGLATSWKIVWIQALPAAVACYSRCRADMQQAPAALGDGKLRRRQAP